VANHASIRRRRMEAHGAPSQLSNLPGLPTISYGGTIGSTVGLDGEGRITQVTAGSGQNPVTGVSYNSASAPTQVNFGSGDNDIFAYDSNTLRMTQFKFNVGTQSQYLNGGLTWNANGTLSQLAITDLFNSANTQTCNYSHDDLARIASANCGSAANQTFSFDPFGNINKSGSPYTFNAFYSSSTNQITCIGGSGQSCTGGFIPTYDNSGNVTNDSNHTYAWDADGNSVTVDSVGLTFDALDRMVEQNRSGSHTQIVCDPSGDKLALMNGQTLTKAFVPLPGLANAVYTSSGLDHYRHSDLLGSSRLTSSPSRAYMSSLAYAPYGETYAPAGTTDPSFTGMNPDTSSTDYDFLYREYSIQGRWPSPDPARFAADPSNPQSWNRYSYALNDPCDLLDPLGLSTCNFIVSVDNQAGLSVQNIINMAYRIDQILATTPTPNGDTVSADIVMSGPADITLKLINSTAAAVFSAATGNELLGLGSPINAFSPRVYTNIISYNFRSNSDYNLGTIAGNVAVHELTHNLSGIGDLSYDPKNPNLMSLDNNPNSLTLNSNTDLNALPQGLQLTSAQAKALFDKCRQLHPATAGGGGGGPADPTHGGIGVTSGSTGTSWFYLYYSWLLLQPIEVVTWHFVY
jgi:RHS repeat-associated protein